MEDLLYKASKNDPDGLFILSDQRSWTFREAHMLVQGTVDLLRKKGFEPGDFLGIATKDVRQTLLLLLASLRMGVVACLLSTRLPEEQLLFQARSLSCRDCIFAFKKREGRDEELGSWDLSKIATLVFTSGSTASPKAALHSLGNHIRSAEGANENCLLRARDRWLLSLPLYHVGGLSIVFRCLLEGATLVLPPLQEHLQRFSVTHLSLVSTQLQRLLDSCRPPSSLKAVLLGGSAFSKGLIKRAYDEGWPLIMSYGLTEMSSQVCATALGDSLDCLYTSGRLLKGRELKIDEMGEILLRGDCLFWGYLGQEVQKGQWFSSGDLGVLDGQGYLHVTGRKDRLFISGGENIQPEEIEKVLCDHPRVQRCYVRAVEDSEYGFRPVAYIEGEKISVPDLRKYLESLLPRFKIPKSFHPWPERAKGAMKIRKEDFS